MRTKTGLYFRKFTEISRKAHPLSHYSDFQKILTDQFDQIKLIFSNLLMNTFVTALKKFEYLVLIWLLFLENFTLRKNTLHVLLKSVL